MAQKEDGPAYLRDGIYKLDEVLPFVLLERGVGPCRNGLKPNERNYGNKVVKMSSKRLKTFVTKGVICVSCGLAGTYFALERHRILSRHSDPNVWHFNLYAVDADGVEVLMTRDHIKPLSKNGPDNLDNSQTMCARCNNRKGNNVEEIPTNPEGANT